MGRVGRRIRALRTGKSAPRMTQEALAERAEISVSFLSMVERGERAPHLDTLARLAEALEVPLEELFVEASSSGERVEAVLRPLLDYAKRQSLDRRDVERLLAVARAMFGE